MAIYFFNFTKYNLLVSNKIIIYNNNDNYALYLQELLGSKGYEIILSDNEFDILQKVGEHLPKLIITSYNLSTLDGETFYKSLSSKFPEIAVIFISNVRDEEVITSIMSYPNCEFMVKPVVTEELLARIKIMTGEEPLKKENIDLLNIQAIELDRKTKIAKKNNDEVALTPTEFRLLEYLMLNKNIVLSREKILNEIWETNQDITDRIVDVYIGYLREKIDPNGELIQTVQGFGYKFCE